jgi:hypothetical protein
MKNQRILFLSVIAVVATMIVAGCASNNTTTTTSTPTTSTTPASTAAKIFGSEGLYNSESAKGLPTKAGCSSGSPPCAADRKSVV